MLKFILDACLYLKEAQYKHKLCYNYYSTDIQKLKLKGGGFRGIKRNGQNKEQLSTIHSRGSLKLSDMITIKNVAGYLCVFT